MQGFETMEMVTVAIAGRARNLEPGQSLEQNRDGDLELEAGKRRPDAKVDAGTEAHMRVGRALRLEPIRLRKARRIAIGRPEQKPDHLALLDANAPNLD